jgi:hypothetical protein
MIDHYDENSRSFEISNYVDIFDLNQDDKSLWSSFKSLFDSSSSSTSGNLPSAATCFNLLKLPNYPSFDVMLEKLTLAIENDTGFGLA